MTLRTVRRLGLCLAVLVAALPAWAQNESDDPGTCGPAAKNPPANSPPLIRCLQIFAHPVNETMVDAQTYDYYIRTPRTLPSQDKWAPYNEETVLADFRTLLNTQFLDNIWVEVRDEPFDNGVMGKHVIFHIEERKRVKAVEYAPVGEGAKLRVDVSKIDSTLKERNIEVSLDTFVDEATIRKVANVVRELYANEGYNDAKVDATTREVAGGSRLVDLRFNIDEGPKVRLKEVTFDGNAAVSDDALAGQMKDNRPRSRMLILTGGGQYRDDKYADDAEKITEYYKDIGYAGAQLGAPQIETVEMSRDGKTRWIRMRIPVEEGMKYSIGKLEITGNEALKTEGLRPFFEIKEGDTFSLKKIRKGLEKLKELYGAFGYYQWAPDVTPMPRGINPETGQPIGPEPPPPIMDVTLKMNEGKRFFVNRITFTGNHTTRDPVIRRELRIAEGDVFNSEALKTSIRRLNQLGYFKPLEGKEGEMEVTPTEDADNRLDVKLNVTEQNRNQVAFGAGVSQFEGVFGQLSFQTSNFLGRGEVVGVSLQKGSQARQYQLSFSEPYLYDRPMTLGIDLHSRQFIYIGQFTQRSTGASTVLGFPLADYTRFYGGYSYEEVSVLDVNPAYLSPQVLATNPFLADSLLLGQGGSRRVSKVSPSIVFNTVNQPLFPTSGTRYSVSFDVAGLGGNTSYNQAVLEGIWYLPIRLHHSLGLRAQAQYIRPYGDTRTLPIFEKVFIGGEYTIRGFDLRSIAPHDALSGVITGGNKSIVLNAEYYVDIGQVRVLGFFDAGQVKDIGQSFSRWEPITRTVAPGQRPLINLDLIQPLNLLTAPGAIRTEIVGRSSAIKSSTGIEARFVVPIINIPFRLIAAYNPNRFGVLDNNGTLTKKFTFRFAVGTTF